MPRIHHREEQCRKAESALRQALLDWYEAHEELTFVEHLRIVNTVFSDHVGGILRHFIRQERHGDPNKPGGLE